MQAYQGLPGNVQALPWQTNKTFVIYFTSLQKPIKPYIMVFLRLNL